MIFASTSFCNHTFKSSTYFVDNNLECVSILKRNLKDIPDSNYQILNMDYLKALNYFYENKKQETHHKGFPLWTAS